MTEPSAGAVRAAKDIEYQGFFNLGKLACTDDMELLVKIIDEQTALPDLISALEHLLHRYRFFMDKDEGDDVAIKQSVRALAKSKGESS